MLTDDGGVAAFWLLDNVIIKPPAGAAELIRTVPVEDFPPTTVVGASVNDNNTGGLTVRFADVELPPKLAVIEARIWVETASVFTVKLALVLPAATITEAGTVAQLWLLDSCTTIPPVGAAALSTTFPVDGDPPPTLVGFNVIDRRLGGLIVKAAVCETPPSVPVTVAIVWDPTEVVLTANVAVVLPAGMNTLTGTEADFWLLDNLIVMPPLFAGAVRVAVPVEDIPPLRVEGLSAID